jgi:putative addiction module component (TIGR02574 family)
VQEEQSSVSLRKEKAEELRRRKQRYLQHPSSGRTWEQVKDRARSRNA